VIYIFEVMRAETLVGGIMRRARRSLKRRSQLMTSIAQVTDIAFGSMQLGDIPVCVLSIEVLGQFVAGDYVPAKKKMGVDWFRVGHAELPGASDQIIAEVNRARTWFEYTVMSSFVDMVGLTPIHRKEAVHAIAVATRNIGLAAIEIGDPELAELCLRYFNTYLRSAINRSAPTFASGIMNEYRRYAIGALEWRRDLAVEAAAHLLRYGRHVDAALSRMEAMQTGLFWEVNERVISFDWLEQPLREQIPRLRSALKRAKAVNNGALLEVLVDDVEDRPAGGQDLVKPTAPHPVV